MEDKLFKHVHANQLIKILIIMILNFMATIHSYDCTDYRFPFILGGDSGGTEITTIATETKDSTTRLYFAGTSSDSDVASGAFYGSFNMDYQQINYLKGIGSIDKIEHMSIMGSGDAEMLLITSRSSNTNIFYLYSINKNDGTISTTRIVDSSIKTQFSSIDSRLMSAHNYHSFLANSWSNIYLSMKFTGHDRMGILRLNDFRSNSNIDWYQELSCSSYSICHIDSMVESGSNDDFIYAVSMVKDTGADKTYGQLHHFDKAGQWYWTRQYEEGSASMSDWYEGVRTITLNTDKRLVIVQNLASTGQIQITNFNQISNNDHNSVPQTSKIKTKRFESSSSTFKIMDAFPHASHNQKMYIIVHDFTTSSGQTSLMELNLGNYQFRKVPFSISSGSNFKVMAYAKMVSASSATNSFFYAGHTSGVTDGTTSQSWSQKQGFIMISSTSDANLACLSMSENWDSDGSFSSMSNIGVTWSSPTLSWTRDNSISQTMPSNSYNSLSDSPALTMSDKSFWCTRAGANSLTWVDPTELPDPTAITYTPTTGDLDTQLTNYSLSDTSCSKDMGLQLSMTCQWTKLDSTVVTATTTPTVHYDAGALKWYIRTTGDNSIAGDYACTMTVTAANISAAVFTHTDTFNIKVLDYCATLTDLQAPTAVKQVSYQINSASPTDEQLGPDAYGFDASCASYVTYSLAWANLNTSAVSASNTNSAVYFSDSADRFFNVRTDMNEHESYGTTVGWLYDLVLTATHTNGITASCQIQLEIKADCSVETVTNPGSFADQTYTINSNEVLISYTNFNAWTTSRGSCHVSYSLLVDDVDVGSLTYELITIRANDLRIYSTYNYWAGKTPSVKYKGCNNATICVDELFTITVQFDCLTNTNLDYSGITMPDKQYTVGSGDTSIGFPKPSFSDNGLTIEWCTIDYTVYYDAACTNQVPSTATANSIYKTATAYNAFKIDYTDKLHADVSTVINTGGVTLYVKAQLTQEASRTTVSDPFLVRIYPDCSLETVTVTSAQTALSDYNLKSGQSVYTLPTMQTSLAFCELTYTVQINGTDLASDAGLQAMFGFTSSNQELTVDISDNQYGNQLTTISLIGQNSAGISDQHDLTLYSKKNCSQASINSYTGFSGVSLDYIITDPDLTINIPTVGSDDQYCYRQYRLYFKDADNPSSTFTLFTNQTHDFIKTFDLPYMDDGQNNYVKIGSNDQAFIGGVQTKNYTLKILVDFLPTENGADSTESETTLRIDSLCTKVTISNVTLSYSYFIRVAKQTQTIPLYTASWPDSTYTETQLHTLCGTPNYFLHADMADDASYDNIFTDLTFGSPTDAPPANVISISYQSSDTNKAGGIDGSGNRYAQTVITAYIVGQLGTYYKARGYAQIHLTAIDDCWYSEIKPVAGYAFVAHQARLNQASYYVIPHFYDTATTDYTNRTGSPHFLTTSDYNCGTYTYWLSNDDGSLPLKSPDNYLFYLFENYDANNLAIRVFGTQNVERNVYNMRLNVKFSSNSNWIQSYQDITINLVKCKVQYLESNLVQNRTFNLQGGAQRWSVDFRPMYQYPDCRYEQYYTASVVGDVSGGWNGLNNQWPSFLTLVNDTTDDLSMYFQMEDLQDLSYEGTTLQLHFTVTIIDLDPSEMSLEYSENIPWQIDFVYFPYNEAPSYDKDPQSKTVSVGDVMQMSTGPASADTVSVVVECLEDEDRLNLFLEFGEWFVDDTFSVTFKLKPTKMTQASTYDFRIVLHDEDEPEPLSREYKFFFVVRSNLEFHESLDLNKTKSDELESNDTMKQDEFNMTIRKIYNNGTMILKFSQPLNQSKVDKLINMNFEQIEEARILEISVEAGKDQDDTKLGIVSYTVISAARTELFLDVRFENPYYISQARTSDLINIKLRDDSYITSNKGQKLDLVKSSQQQILPLQMVPTEGFDFFASVEELKGTMQSLSVGTLIGNILWQGSLNHLWSMIYSMQVTVHVQLINTRCPANVQIFNDIIMQISYFEILPEEGLEPFYFWKLFDGQYFSNKEEKGMLPQNQTQIQYQNSSKQLKAQKQLENQNGNTSKRMLISISDQKKVDKYLLFMSDMGKSGYYSQEQILTLTGINKPYEIQTIESITAVEENPETQLSRGAYGSDSIIENMGTIFVMAEIFVFFLITVMFMRVICCYLCKKPQINFKYGLFKDQIFWGVFLRFGLQTYLEVALASQINLRLNYRNQHSVHELWSYFFAIFGSFFVIAYPIYTIVLLTKNYQRILKEKQMEIDYIKSNTSNKSYYEKGKILTFRTTYGTLYNENNIESFWKLWYYAFFMLRRLLLAIVLVQFESQPQFQIQLITLLNLIFLMYIGIIKPLEVRFQNRLELFNEWVNMMATYNFFVFTEFVDNMETQYQVGWTNIGMVSLLVAINMAIILGNSLYSIQKHFEKQRRKKEQKEREEKYLKHREQARVQFQKQIDKALKSYNYNKENQISQPRDLIHALHDQSISDKLEQIDQDITQDGIENGNNQIQFHTSRFNSYNRFADMMSKKMSKQQKIGVSEAEQIQEIKQNENNKQEDDEKDQSVFKVGRAKPRKRNWFKRRTWKPMDSRLSIISEQTESISLDQQADTNRNHTNQKFMQPAHDEDIMNNSDLMTEQDNVIELVARQRQNQSKEMKLKRRSIFQEYAERNCRVGAVGHGQEDKEESD